MKKLEQLYEGKAKKVFATDDPNVVLVDYKDDATAFNGLKKGTIMGKGVINNRVTNFLMKMLEKNGIPTLFLEFDITNPIGPFRIRIEAMLETLSEEELF